MIITFDILHSIQIIFQIFIVSYSVYNIITLYCGVYSLKYVNTAKLFHAAERLTINYLTMDRLPHLFFYCQKLQYI